MAKKIILSIAFLITTLFVFGSILKGTITDISGNPLPYASIFVPETGSGTVTNEDGYYEIRLKSGRYEIIFQYLGYQAEQRTVSLGSGKTEVLNIILKDETLELSTIEITDGREDPAYTIMRKAIAKAEFHQNQIDSYTAQVYIKGSGRLLDSPRLFAKAIEKEGVDTSTAYLVESVSNISYQRPNTFTEKVISIRQQGDDYGTDPNPYINSSFYQAQVAETVSPLSPRAFGYYKFEFLGSYIERNVEINKIKVVPRSRGEGVFEGEISIVNNAWSIHSLDLLTYKFGITFNVKQFYAPIKENAWLPVTHRLDVDAKIFGFKFTYDYLATVSNYDIRINPDLNYDFELIDEKIDKEKAAIITQKPKASDLETKLASGEELTRKELRKLMKAYHKEEVKEREEPKVLTNYSHSIDSTAENRDTAFWENIRPVPLTKYELKTYQKVDSINLVRIAQKENPETVVVEKSKSNSNGLWSSAWNLFSGRSWKTGQKSRLTFDGLLHGLNLNTVQGLYAAPGWHWNTRLANKRNLKIGAIPVVEIGGERLIGTGYLDIGIGNNGKLGNIRLEGGRAVNQINENNPIEPYVNAIYTVLFEDNYLKVYQKDFVSLSFQKQLTDNFHLDLQSEYANRKALENLSDFDTFINDKDDDLTPNNPFNSAIQNTAFADNAAITLSASFEWKPWLRYSLNNDAKSFSNLGPTIIGQYRKGMNDVDYDLVELGLKYHWIRHDGSRLDIRLVGGKFLNDETLIFPDFKHFLGNRTAFTTNNPLDSYRLLDYYRHSTNDEYLQTHAHYQFRKLLFTQIPFFWQRGYKENAFINYLATPSSNDYMEIGYGIDNILKFLRVEFVASFEDFEFDRFGVVVGVSTAIGVSSSDDEGTEISINF